MPFEPLQTDEKIEGPQPKKADFDAEIMAGCGQFVIQSGAFYGLGAWPFFAFPDLFELRSLAINLCAGLAACFVLAFVSTRKFGVPAAAGSFAGSMVLAIFLFLRLQQIHIPSVLNSVPLPEWPQQWVWMIPLTVMVATALLLGLTLKKSDWDIPESKSPPTITRDDADN